MIYPDFKAHIFPLILLFEFVPFAFIDFDYGGVIALKILQILLVLLVIALVKRVFKSTTDYLKTKPRFSDKPIDSYIQVFMIFAWIVGVSINDMVGIGDWITFEKYGADGDVIEINLATVKVQNFDKTITTIPTYALISDSFKNWRGMQVCGGRRIKRALIISQKSIRFLSDKDVTKLKKIQLITQYLNMRTSEINIYNDQQEADKSSKVNGRNLTNFGVFRKYVSSYLEKHSAINKTMMVRQLEPTPQGISLEIYAFSADKRWENYEYIMADIFDHLLSAMSSFELEVFELPTSLDGKKAIVI